MHGEIAQDRGGSFSVQSDTGEALTVKNNVGLVAPGEGLVKAPGNLTVELVEKTAGFVRRKKTALVTANRFGKLRIDVFPPKAEAIEDRQSYRLICCHVNPAKKRTSPSKPPGKAENFS
ncbi:MAG: hypothetical protein EXR85_03500 [Xanthomonadales bacterium]|nr:hypothetical protein [Xanthomonadales bacterium]